MQESGPAYFPTLLLALVFGSRAAWRQRSFLLYEFRLSPSSSGVKHCLFPQRRGLDNAISDGEDYPVAMFTSNSAEETIAAGRAYGQKARKGDVFALAGDLGAGKTQFVKGFVAGLESSAEVTSPTFVLIHEYGDGRLPVYHFDFYRLDSGDAVLRLGFDDYIFGDGVSLIEWADRYPDLIPKEARWLSFEVKGDDVRMIRDGRPQ